MVPRRPLLHIIVAQDLELASSAEMTIGVLRESRKADGSDDGRQGLPPHEGRAPPGRTSDSSAQNVAPGGPDHGAGRVILKAGRFSAPGGRGFPLRRRQGLGHTSIGRQSGVNRGASTIFMTGAISPASVRRG